MLRPTRAERTPAGSLKRGVVPSAGWTRRGRPGFTMIEMINTLLVFGALALIAFPAFFRSQARMASMHAADEFVMTHSLTRAIAIRHGRVAELHIDAGTGEYWVEMDTTVMRTGVMDTIGPIRSVPEGVTMTSTSGLLCFDARGLGTPILGCPTGSAIVVFNRGGYADTVVATALGKILR